LYDPGPGFPNPALDADDPIRFDPLLFLEVYVNPVRLKCPALAVFARGFRVLGESSATGRDLYDQASGNRIRV
jgi:hypothetical protein